MFYVLQNRAHGDPLGEYDSLEQAQRALDRVAAGDPAGARELAIVAYDESDAQGKPVVAPAD